MAVVVVVHLHVHDAVERREGNRCSRECNLLFAVIPKQNRVMESSHLRKGIGWRCQVKTICTRRTRGQNFSEYRIGLGAMRI